MSDDLSKQVCDLAGESGLADDAMLAMYSKVHAALRQAFGDTSVDSGVGGGWCDFWVKEGDVEYKLVMKPHRNLGRPQ